MKKILLGILIGIVITSGVVIAASVYSAKDIEFNSNNFTSTNVNDAILELYEVNKGVISDNNLVAAGSYSGCSDNIYIPITHSKVNNYYVSQDGNNLIINKSGSYRVYEGVDGTKYNSIYSNADFRVNSNLIFNITVDQFGGTYATGKFQTVDLNKDDVLTFVGHAKAGAFCTSLNFFITYEG